MILVYGYIVIYDYIVLYDAKQLVYGYMILMLYYTYVTLHHIQLLAKHTLLHLLILDEVYLYKSEEGCYTTILLLCMPCFASQHASTTLIDSLLCYITYYTIQPRKRVTTLPRLRVATLLYYTII